MISQKIILIVEDNEINRAMLRGILESEYKVLEAPNGLEALKVLNDQKDNVSLILLDIVMPVMDGYTFLSILKNDPSISSIPVIVATQNDNESDEVAALSHGATDFVAKPYRPQIILHRVASIISLRESAAMINQFRYDRLTSLYSKEFFYRRVREELQAHPDREYDMLCSNIENFKLINDILGVPAGDQLLISVAEMIQEKIGERGICGRLSADQFACLIRRPQAYPQEYFIHANSEINTLANMQNVVVKWGVYVIRDKQVSVEQMCDRALLAVRRIKGQYNNYVAAYDDTLRNKLLREQAITDSMEAALKERQFVIYLQPKFQIKDDQLAGAEALVRWNHPQWGCQSPAEFIPLFERNGFITKLDQYVWEQSCAELHRWDQAGYPQISVSVNVSRADIYNSDLIDFLTRILKKYELQPSRLHLEITESAYTENPGQIIATVEQLRTLGFVIEMDDFGSGYSGKPHTPMSLWKRVQRTQSLSVLRQQEQILREEAYRDYLTGLLNRRGLSAVCQALRQDDAPLALFRFDLDNLKKVNDQLGRDQGDQRIRQFSHLLRSHFRQSDILARLDQDEFIVVMKKTARKEAVVRKGEALGQAVVEAGWNQDVPLTVSAGIAMWDLSETLDEVLARADSALKCAKVGCQSRCRLWEEANVWGIRSEIVKK